MFVDLPWVVPQKYSDATRPAGCRDIATPCGSFVASGEQSFLQLREEGRLCSRTQGFVGWTPCLRDERRMDELHQHGFMKAEWFVPLKPGTDEAALLESLVQTQERLFIELGTAAGSTADLRKALTREVLTPEAVDILLAGIEVGSYGVREFLGARYLYGTALALPRFQQALDRVQG